jgi:hypothetical protein
MAAHDVPEIENDEDRHRHHRYSSTASRSPASVVLLKRGVALSRVRRNS